MRSYSTRLVALTLDVQTRWLDNLLSRFPLPGVVRRARGAERRIRHSGIMRIELIRVLNLELGVSVQDAVRIAAMLHDSSTMPTSAYRLPSGVSLVVPLDAMERRLRSRLADATESVAAVPRGRPPHGKASPENEG